MNTRATLQLTGPQVKFLVVCHFCVDCHTSPLPLYLLHPESRPSGGHEITTVVMKFVTFFHDHGPHFHDHVTSFHDWRLQILFIVQIYSSGHEITSAVMNGTLRSILGTIFFSGHEIVYFWS